MIIKFKQKGIKIEEIIKFKGQFGVDVENDELICYIDTRVNTILSGWKALAAVKTFFKQPTIISIKYSI